jgi:hypothetical protein
MMGVVLLMALLMGACSSGEDLDEGEKPVQMIMTRLNFSLPSRIAGKKAQPTRMSDDVTQAKGENGQFRGIDAIHMLCYKESPTASSNKIGNIIELNTKSNDVTEEVTQDDYALSKEIDVPVGTSYFGFYASAEEEAVPTMSEHERRMHYGVVEAVGIDKRSYQGNNAIRFKPVPICTSNEKLGGSSKGLALLNLLNSLINISLKSVPAPNNRWETAENLYLYEAYQRLTQMTTLSSDHVQRMLGFILKLINQEAPDDRTDALVAAITQEIKDHCNPESVPDIENGEIVLMDSYQGFPDDIHLPSGAARIKWNADLSRFEAAEQDYGKGLTVPSMNDYVYPMSLQYQIFSDIVASDELVINSVNEEGEIVPPESAEYKNWSELLEKGYGEDAEKSVQPTTRSVAMVKQVEYAVGSLALRARILPSGNFYDANGKLVDVSEGFTLKGYIVGGQREVDYNYQPVSDSHVYAIYDTDLDPAITSITQHTWAEAESDKFDYILGLSTMTDKNIYLAMELVNNCPDFQGADGIIVHGATFYLVANLELPENIYGEDIPKQIFCKDRATRVDLTITNGWPDKNGDGKPDPDTDETTGLPKPINGLATATYGLPDLEIPHPTLGLSVNLSWGEGLWFNDVEL